MAFEWDPADFDDDDSMTWPAQLRQAGRAYSSTQITPGAALDKPDDEFPPLRLAPVSDRARRAHRNLGIE